MDRDEFFKLLDRTFSRKEIAIIKAALRKFSHAFILEIREIAFCFSMELGLNETTTLQQITAVRIWLARYHFLTNIDIQHTMEIDDE